MRAGERVAARRTTSFYITGHGDIPVTLANISLSGVGVAASHFLPIGESAHLRIGDAAEIPLIIQWQLGGYAGARFAPHVSHETITSLLTLFAVPLDDAA